MCPRPLYRTHLRTCAPKFWEALCLHLYKRIYWRTCTPKCWDVLPPKLTPSLKSPLDVLKEDCTLISERLCVPLLEDSVPLISRKSCAPSHSPLPIGGVIGGPLILGSLVHSPQPNWMTFWRISAPKVWEVMCPHPLLTACWKICVPNFSEVLCPLSGRLASLKVIKIKALSLNSDLEPVLFNYPNK